MRWIENFPVTITAALVMVGVMCGQDSSRAIAGGGISAPGWTGAVDPNAANAGQSVHDAKFTEEGKSLLE